MNGLCICMVSIQLFGRTQKSAAYCYSFRINGFWFFFSFFGSLSFEKLMIFWGKIIAESISKSKCPWCFGYSESQGAACTIKKGLSLRYWNGICWDWKQHIAVKKVFDTSTLEIQFRLKNWIFAATRDNYQTKLETFPTNPDKIFALLVLQSTFLLT